MVDLQAESLHLGGQPQPAVKGRLGVWLVNEPHQPQVYARMPSRARNRAWTGSTQAAHIDGGC